MAFVQLSHGYVLEQAEEGLFAGLVDAGIRENIDVEIKKYNAQGDFSQLTQIFDAIKTTSADLIITSTTPAMIAAAHATKTIPVVFTVASKPSAVDVVAAGERQRHLVGVYDNPPLARLLDLAVQREETIQKVGTIWNPAEPNSEISVKRLREACQEREMELVERNAAATNELRDVTSAICQLGIDILVISADNVTTSGFPVIRSVASQSGIHIYCTEPDLVDQGATAAIGVDFSDWGRQTARLAAMVLAGVEPSSIPDEEVISMKTVIAKDE